MKWIISCFLLSWCGLVYSQELEFTTPVPLSSSVNSVDEELAPLLSPDGKTLYFARAFHEGNNGGKFAGTDIWISHKDEQGEWMPASKMDNTWNNKRSNAVIGINADQSVVYLLNAYTNKSGISFSKYFNGKWSEPEFIPIPGISSNDFVGFYVNPQFDVILVSMKGLDTLGEEDIYISLNDSGKWSEPRNLGPTINTTGFEISPFLTNDKKRLYFSSNGHGGFGDADIFYCDRLFDSWETWSVPKNLGSTINSDSFDAFFTIHADSLAIYCNNSMGFSDIKVAGVKIAKLIHKDGKQLLLPEETISVFGSKISPEIKFERGIKILTSQQSELLYFIANKLLYRPDIVLQVQLSNYGTESEMRANTIVEKLKSFGISENRIDLKLIEYGDKGLVKILFYK
jgi:hypothetical protein